MVFVGKVFFHNQLESLRVVVIINKEEHVCLSVNYFTFQSCPFQIRNKFNESLINLSILIFGVHVIFVYFIQ